MAIDPKRVKEIFLETAELSDEGARAAYLDRACESDAGLRVRVEALLRPSHDPEGSFFGAPAAVAPDPDPGATKALTGTPDPDAAATRTAGGENDFSQDEALTFLAPAARPDALGRIGHYEVLQVLGRGSFGIVFRAFDEVLQRVVALKVLAPQLAATSPARNAFCARPARPPRSAMRTWCRCTRSPSNRCPTWQWSSSPAKRSSNCSTGSVRSMCWTCCIGRQIAEGLAAAHATDLIHRDIKPGNVLLEGSQQKVKITDFGLARTADDASISQSGIIAGTPMYMAPEQALGQTLDQRADLFSLGSVLYQMVAGRPPFRANSTVAVLRRVAEDKPRAIREIVPETPQWLCDIIAKLHAKNPDERYQSAREVADVLADCEAQLEANSGLKDFSRIPRGKSASSGTWKWLAAATVLLLPVLALALTEITGVTHLLQKQPPLAQVAPKGDAEVDPKQEPKTSPVTGSFALAFHGQNSLVRIPSLRINKDHALTVETWAVLEDPVDRRKNYDLVCNAASAGFALGVPPSQHGGDGRKLGLRHVFGNDPGVFSGLGEQPVPRHQLIHFAGVYDGKAEIRFSINGQLQSRTPIQGVRTSGLPLTLGGNSHGSDAGSRFLGRMNEVRISRVARYDTDFTPARRWEPDMDTIALYHFDEGEGTVLRDSSGNGHNGEIVGAKWVKADGSPIGPPPAAKTPPPAAAPGEFKE